MVIIVVSHLTIGLIILLCEREYMPQRALMAYTLARLQCNKKVILYNNKLAFQELNNLIIIIKTKKPHTPDPLLTKMFLIQPQTISGSTLSKYNNISTLNNQPNHIMFK